MKKKDYHQKAISSLKNSKDFWNHIQELDTKIVLIFPC